MNRMLSPILTTILLVNGVVAFAQNPSPVKPSLDEELLDSLNSELLEGLETVPTDDGTKKDGEKNSDNIATSDEDAFTRIGKRMREVEHLIAKAESKTTAKRIQREIVDDLTQLIADLEKQCQKCQGGASSNSQPSDQVNQREQVNQPATSGKQKSGGQHDSRNPAKDSTSQLGKDETRKAALEKMQKLLKEDRWGELPAKAREQMLQLSPEQFLPKYELLIEEYYKRLAEQPEK